MAINAEGQGHLATLAGGHLDCMSFISSKDIFSKTAGPISNKFQLRHPNNGGTKVCSNGPGHMTKEAAMLKCG